MVWTAKEILQLYADEAFSDWDEFLPMAEMVMNNTVTAVTGYLPTYLCCGRKIDLGGGIDRHGGDLMERMSDALEEAKTSLEKNRARIERRLESLRQQGVTIESMDWVMVESSGINYHGHEQLSQKNLTQVYRTGQGARRRSRLGKLSARAATLAAPRISVVFQSKAEGLQEGRENGHDAR